MDRKEKMDKLLHEYTKDRFSHSVPDDFSSKLMQRIEAESISPSRAFIDEYLWVFVMFGILAVVSVIFLVPLEYYDGKHSFLNAGSNGVLVESFKDNLSFWVRFFCLTCSGLYLYFVSVISRRDLLTVK